MTVNREARIPARAATDDRLSEPHFRLLILLAGAPGWTTIARSVGLLGTILHAPVRRRLERLVQWGYVERSELGNHYRLRRDETVPAFGDWPRASRQPEAAP